MKEQIAPESSAVRVALWRALHVQVDAPPLLEDETGLKLAAPADDWRSRPDMDPEGTKLFRASIIARARFVEDLVEEQAEKGVNQYVILGAGLDSFAQRRPEIAARLRIFEVDRPGAQEWKRRRLIELGFGVSDWLRLVPVDFESGESWLERLENTGFDKNKPAVVVSTGVSMYLTKDAITTMLQQAANLAAGSTFVMTFLLPLELMDPELQPGFQMAEKGARTSGTPFISFFSPPEILGRAQDAGFKHVEYILSDNLAKRYFAVRADGLRPLIGEELLVATT